MAVKRGIQAKLKKCIINTLRQSKITTPKSAVNAFNKAARKCRKLILGETPKPRKRKRKSTKPRRPLESEHPFRSMDRLYDPYEGIAPVRPRRHLKIVRTA